MASSWSASLRFGRTLSCVSFGFALSVAFTAIGAPKQPIAVDVRLTTTPAGASVEVDGQPLLQVTPVSTKLAPGPHRVTATREGFARLDTSITVKAGKAQRIELRLAALPARLTVTTEPTGAQGELDGVAMGSTPFTATADGGFHELAVGLAGYRPTHRRVELSAGAHSTLELTLEPLPVAVTFDVTPAGTALTIDGVDGGVSPTVLELSVGSHWGMASHAGYRTQALAFEVRPASPTRVAATLEADGGSTGGAPLVGPKSPHLLPPPPPPREDLALVADEAVSPSVKLGVVRAALQRTEDVTALVQATRPRAQRGVLCTEIGARAMTVPVVVRAVDPFGESVSGTLLVDGKRWGPLPFRGELPVCTGVIAATDVGTAEPKEHPVELEQESSRTVELRVGGRRSMSVVSLLGEYDSLVWSAFEGGVTGEAPHFGSGFRFDSWGHVLHFTAAMKFSPALNVPTNWVLKTSATGVFLGGFPTLDVFVGWGSALGNLAIDRVRVHWALDVGLWSLVFPTARASVAIDIVDLIFVTIGGDLHFNPVMLTQQAVVGKNPFDVGILFPGVTLALGVGF